MSKAEQTRNFIIEKTAPIFNVKGYAGTSLNDIIQATSLTKGSIYGNFANKDEVALAAFDYNLNTMTSKIEAAMGKQDTVRDKLLVYANIYRSYLTGDLIEGGCPVLNTATDADDTHPALRKKALNAVLAWKMKISGLVQAGISNGEFRADVHPEQVALTMIAIVEGAIMISRLTQQTQDWKLIMNSLKMYVEHLS